MKKAQSSIEFIILVGAMLFVFISFLFIFQQNVAAKATEKRNLEVHDLALQIQSEVAIASSSINGYQRTFNVPAKIINQNYNITLNEGIVYIITEDNKNAISLPIQNVTGQIKKGDNTIRKLNEVIYINI